MDDFPRLLMAPFRIQIAFFFFGILLFFLVKLEAERENGVCLRNWKESFVAYFMALYRIVREMLRKGIQSRRSII